MDVVQIVDCESKLINIFYEHTFLKYDHIKCSLFCNFLKLNVKQTSCIPWGLFPKDNTLCIPLLSISSQTRPP